MVKNIWESSLSQPPNPVVIYLQATFSFEFTFLLREILQMGLERLQWSGQAFLQVEGWLGNPGITLCDE